MKQFWKILKFELAGYLKNKIFVGVTVFLVAAIAVCMFIPNIAGAFRSDGAPEDTGEQPVLLLYADDPELSALARPPFERAFPGYRVETADGTPEEFQNRITEGSAACGFALNSFSSCTYYVNNLSMQDMNPTVASEVLQEVSRMQAMIGTGLTPEQAQEILSAPVESRTVVLGKDQVENFLYTYIMVFALYMVILLYGQMVATNVATEKSSRAMELLITSAKPTSMMFGKVTASCLAGLLQLAAIFGTALICYHGNEAAWRGNEIMASLFNIPVELFVYLLVFFVLGFLLYAFMYGAIGSTASRLEDINTSVMPVTFLYIIAFMIVIFSMIFGSTDSTLMKICSYIPFTSPMAMFARICMSTVAWYEIAASIAILMGSVVGIGYLAAKIYRVGVLLYGTTPRLGAILKAVRKS